MRRARIAALLACSGTALAACGSGNVTVAVTPNVATTPPQSGSSSSTATSAAPTVVLTPKPELLFAVVESHTTPNPQPGYIDDTVAVVGLDGVARTKTTFTPRTQPQIGNAAAVLSPEAHVAAGKVFFIDGKGVVHALGPVKGSSASVITTFAAPSPQGYESFAVSPDGMHLIAAVDVLTPFVPPSPNDQNNPFGSGGEQDHDTIAAADAGGAARTLYTLAHPSKPLFIGGWDSQSAIGLTDPPLGTQSGFPPGWSSPAARLDAGGHPGAVLGPATCRAIEGLLDGTVVCQDFEGGTGSATDVVSVHGPAVGDWTVPIPPNTYPANQGGAHLSADGKTVVFPVSPSGTFDPKTTAQETADVMTKGGAVKKLADNFAPEGFLDADTVIGEILPSDPQASATGELGTVHLSGGGVTDLGFKGAFVGVVQQAV